MTITEFELATSRLTAQCLNQLRHYVAHVSPIAKEDADRLLTSAHKVERRGLSDAAVGASDDGHLPVQPCIAVTPSA